MTHLEFNIHRTLHRALAALIPVFGRRLPAEETPTKDVVGLSNHQEDIRRPQQGSKFQVLRMFLRF